MKLNDVLNAGIQQGIFFYIKVDISDKALC